VEHDVRAVSSDEVAGAGRATDVRKNGNSSVEAVLGPQCRSEVDYRSFRTVGQHQRPGVKPCDALSEPRAQEARGARDQDSGALDVLRVFLRPDVVDDAAEERFQVRFVSDFGAT
jgi:hypothetical protein